MRNVRFILAFILVSGCGVREPTYIYENGDFRIKYVEGLQVEEQKVEFLSLEVEYLVLHCKSLDLSVNAVEIDDYGHGLLFGRADYIGSIRVGKFTEMFIQKERPGETDSIFFVARTHGKTVTAITDIELDAQKTLEKYRPILSAIDVKGKGG